jgi:hypothetical protein
MNSTQGRIAVDGGARRIRMNQKEGVTLMHIPLRAGKLLGATLALVLMLSSQAAADLVVNGGFESGNFTGWTQSGDTSFTSVAQSGEHGYNAQGGNNYAALGPLFSNGFLSQTLATTAGQSYTFSWYLASNGTRPDSFSASWAGATISSQANVPQQNYTRYSFTETASSSSTMIRFAFTDRYSYLALDTVSVVPNAVAAPEPSTAIVGLVGGLGMTGYLWRARRRTAA